MAKLIRGSVCCATTLNRGPYELSSALWPDYDVSADGKRFLVVKVLESSDVPAQINVVLDWTEELKRLVRPD